jgi:hypothetical protein
MAKTFDWVKQSLYLGLIGFLTFLLWANFHGICNATQQILGRAGSMRSLEIASVKIQFDDESVSAAFDEIYKNVDPSRLNMKQLLKAIDALDQRDFVRLMYIGQLQDLCEFDAPATSKMRYDVATDYKLVELNLARMTESPDVLQRVKQQVGRGRLDNGNPLRCYVMELTTEGANVKTALVGNFGAAFKGRAAPADARVASASPAS